MKLSYDILRYNPKEKKGEKIKELDNKIAEEEEKILQYLIELEEEYDDFFDYSDTMH